MKGNVPGLTQEKVNKLARHKTSIIKLTKKLPIKEKRKIFVQKGGGFLPFLLSLVAPLTLFDMGFFKPSVMGRGGSHEGDHEGPPIIR